MVNKAKKDERQKGPPPRLDAANMAGITSLMNPQHINTDVNLLKAEKEIMGRVDNAPKKDIDPVKLYTRELNELAEELGVNFTNDETESSQDEREPAGVASVHTRAPQTFGRGQYSDLVRDMDIRSISSKEETEDDSSLSGTEDEKSTSSEDSQNAEGVSAPGVVSPTPGRTETGDSVYRRRNRIHRIPGVAHSARKDKNAHVTEEQEHRRHINSVLKDMRKETHTFYSVEQERAQDIKASKLEQIGQLRTTLVEEGVDCSGVGAPGLDSSMGEIDGVLNILRMKNDRNRYSAVAEEVILGAAEFIETVFDGSREIPLLNWAPDYTGYHNTVNTKLHRMRYETSQIVGQIIEHHNINPMTRVFMELLPSLILYPRQQQKRRGLPGLYDASRGVQVGSSRHAYANIRSVEATDDIATVQKI